MSFFVPTHDASPKKVFFFSFLSLVIQLTETEPTMFFVHSTTLMHVPEDTLSYQLSKDTTAALKKTCQTLNN